jgi:hypothetical protein
LTLITGLTDEDIRTDWLRSALAEGDDDATDAGDTADADDDATDADDDATDADDDATDA